MREIKEINIVLYIVLCFLTLGMHYFYWQYRQMRDCKILAGKNGSGFIQWFFLSIITFGLYHLYHEYKMSQDIMILQEQYELKVSGSEFPLLCLIISIFGFVLVSDFIHQDELNKIIHKAKLHPELKHKHT